MNNGERDELIAIMKLIEVRDKGLLFDGLQVNSIKVNNQECLMLTPNYDWNKLISLDDAQLTCEVFSFGVGKAPALSKADIYINDIGYSLKSNRSAPPALVNHTTRPGFENVLFKVGSDITKLDEIIDNYWRLRKAKTIAEDVKNTNQNSPFKEHIEYFRPILNYFFFTGTGSSDSKFPAEKTINIVNPIDANSWRIYDETNALDLYWDKLIFSLRAKKGMPAGYPDNMSAKAKLTKDSVDRWTEFIDSDYRGALHIRATK